MSTINLPKVRACSDITFRVSLEDNGVAVDWTGLTDVKALIYSDVQKAVAGRCTVEVDAEDNTVLVCVYSATKPQYLGVNSIVVRCKYQGREKTYDKPAVDIVARTADATGQTVLEDPDVDVEIAVEDVSSSLLDEAIAAAFDAADKAIEASQLVPLQVLEDCVDATEDAQQATTAANEAAAAANAAGVTSVQASIADNEVGTPSVDATLLNKVLSLVFHHLKGAKGDTGATPNITIGTVTTGAAGSSVIVTMTGTAENPVLNLTIPQGLKGDQGNTGSSVDYPFELVDNLTTDDATKALSAAQGVVLDGKISQLQQEVTADISQLELKVDGIIDAGTTYNTLDDTYKRVCVFYPIPDVDATYHLKVTDAVYASGDGLMLAVRSAATPYDATNLYSIPNDQDFTIPDAVKSSAQYIAVNSTLVNSAASFKVILYITNSLKQRIDAIEPRLDDLELFEENQKSTNDSTKQMLSYKPVDVIAEGIGSTDTMWWAYSDGASHGSSNLRCYIINNDGYKWVSLKVASSDTNPCAVAFYNSATPGAESYMKAASVQMKAGVNEYFAEVPDGCVTICVSNRPEMLNTPNILCTKYDVAEGADLIKKELDSRYFYEWLQAPHYGHLWIGTIDGRHPAIPCQSLFDIDATTRLGFKYIEANVHYTSDGVPIPIHGASGKFGREVTDHDGNFTYENTAINSVTYDWIKNNLIYDSKYAKHKTTIPTLEEFFVECKLRGLSVFVTYDSEVYALAKQYFGDNFLAYQGNRDDGFTGMIVRYNDLLDKDDIVAECRRIRPPFAHALSTTAFRTLKENGTIAEIAKAVHDEGCLLAIAGCYLGADDVVYFFESGGDISASDREVNEFQSGNICNLKGDIDFSQFTITNGSVSDGVVTLQDGGTIVSPQYDSIYLGKVSLHIRFNGTLTIRLNGANRQIVSDGKHSVWISSYILENTPNLIITSVGVTEVTSIDYKASIV